MASLAAYEAFKLSQFLAWPFALKRVTGVSTLTGLLNANVAIPRLAIRAEAGEPGVLEPRPEVQSQFLAWPFALKLALNGEHAGRSKVAIPRLAIRAEASGDPALPLPPGPQSQFLAWPFALKHEKMHAELARDLGRNSSPGHSR